MSESGKILKQFYDAAIARDFTSACKYLADDLEFVGLFETYHSAD